MSNEAYGDIRTLSPQEHWAHFEKSWQALITYTYLGKGSPYLDVGVTEEAMPLRHDMRNSTGGITATPLCVLAPEPYWRDDECVPAPVTMTYDILDPAHDVERLLVIRDVISVGRQMGFSRSRIVDHADRDRVIAISTGSGVSLGDVPPGFYEVENPVNDVADSPDLPSLRDVFGVIEGPDGLLQIEKVTPELASPHSALHQGPINVALEAAMTDRLEAVTGTVDHQVESYTVIFTKAGYIGPFVATAEVVGAGSARAGVEATMVDRGNRDRIIATAQASFGAWAERVGKLDGKVAVVTGAGQGMGRGVALALAGEGAQVAVLGRTQAKCDAVAGEIVARGATAVSVGCDTGRRDDVDAAVATTLEAFGRIDVLVNSAQTTIYGSVRRLSEGDLDAMWQSGPMGCLRTMQACFDPLRASRGSVVNMGSGSSILPAPAMSGYAMTKEAIRVLTHVAALEWGKLGVRVNAVCPLADTPGWQEFASANPGADDAVLAQVPLGRMGDAEADVGRAVVFLASEDAAYITGTTLMVDGGFNYLR